MLSSRRAATAPLFFVCALGLTACASFGSGGTGGEAQTLALLAHGANEEGAHDSAARLALAALSIDPGAREAELALRQAAAQNRLRTAVDLGEPIRQIAYSGDGRRLLVRSGAGNVRVLDAQTGAEISRLTGHDAAVLSARFSPDDARVVTGSMDQTARVWDAASGRQLSVLQHGALPPVIDGIPTPIDPVVDARFSPDGARVLTIRMSGAASLWDAASGREIEVIELGGWALPAPRFHPDGARVMTMPESLSATLGEAQWARPMHEYEPEASGRPGRDDYAFAQFSPDGAHVLTIADRTARIWNAADGARIAEAGDFTDFIVSASFSPDGAWAGLASNDWSALMWNWRTGEKARLRGATAPLVSIVFSPDGSRVLTASADGRARLFTAGDVPADSGLDAAPASEEVPPAVPRDIIASFRGAEDGLVDARFSPDGAQIATASIRGELRFWDARGDGEQGEIAAAASGIVQPFISPDGSRMVAQFDGLGEEWRGAVLWDLAADRGIVRFLTPHDVIFSEDGTRVLVAEDEAIRILDAATGREIERRAHAVGLGFRTLSSDGARALVDKEGGGFLVLDVATGRRLAELRTTPLLEFDASFALNGARIVMWNYPERGSTALLWNAETGAQIAELKRDRFDVDVAFVTPDGLRIITVSRFGTGGVWDARTGALIAPFAGIASSETGKGVGGRRIRTRAPFSPDGTRFVAAGEDGAPHIWDAFTGADLLRLNTREGVDLAAFSPNGALIVTASGRNLHLWDAASGRELAALRTRLDRIGGLAFSGDGARIYIYRLAGEPFLVWDAPTSAMPQAALIAHVCANVLRDGLAHLREDELRNGPMLDRMDRNVCARR